MAKPLQRRPEQEPVVAESADTAAEQEAASCANAERCSIRARPPLRVPACDRSSPGGNAPFRSAGPGAPRPTGVPKPSAAVPSQSELSPNQSALPQNRDESPDPANNPPARCEDRTATTRFPLTHIPNRHRQDSRPAPLQILFALARGPFHP